MAEEAVKVSKSKSIRNYLKSKGNRKAKAADVVAALKEQGVEVTPQMVHNVRGLMKRKRAAKAGKPAAKAGMAGKRTKKSGKRRAGRKGRRGGASKAQHIRDAFGSLGLAARPRDVIAAVAEKGIKVVSAQVVTIRKQLKKLRRAGRRMMKAEQASPAPAAASNLAMPELMAAKELADRMGGIESARSALEALEQLRG